MVTFKRSVLLFLSQHCLPAVFICIFCIQVKKGPEPPPALIKVALFTLLSGSSERTLEVETGQKENNKTGCDK